MTALTARQTPHFAHVQTGDGQCGCTSVEVQFPHLPGIRSGTSGVSGTSAVIGGLGDEGGSGQPFLPNPWATLSDDRSTVTDSAGGRADVKSVDRVHHPVGERLIGVRPA